MAARLPATTMGRCSRTGCAAITLAISALPRSAFFLPSVLNCGSLSRIRSFASLPKRSISFSTSALLGGCLRYSRIAGSIPLRRRSSSVCRDLLQRGLCQIVMLILILSPCLPRLTGEARSEVSKMLTPRPVHRGSVHRSPFWQRRRRSRRGPSPPGHAPGCPCGPWAAGRGRAAAVAPAPPRPAARAGRDRYRVRRPGPPSPGRACRRRRRRFAACGGWARAAGRGGAARRAWGRGGVDDCLDAETLGGAERGARLVEPGLDGGQVGGRIGRGGELGVVGGLDAALER